jgi:hypothetical protein
VSPLPKSEKSLFERVREFSRIHLPWIVFSICLIFDVGGILVAVFYTHCDADAGRGGAIADAIALTVMLLDPSYAAKLYSTIATFHAGKAGPAGAVTHETVQNAIEADSELVLDLLNDDAKMQRHQNYYLAAATFLGTLTWGFGDLVARQFIIGKCC